LVRRKFNVIKNAIPKSWEWLIINYVINVAKGVLFGFNIFRGERLRDNYIKSYKTGTCMAMQKKPWIITLLFKKFLSFFNKSILSGLPFNNRHLLILNGHVNHVTLEAIEFGLNMITLPSHTSHALQ
jgi:hypothetical protein